MIPSLSQFPAVDQTAFGATVKPPQGPSGTPVSAFVTACVDASILTMADSDRSRPGIATQTLVPSVASACAPQHPVRKTGIEAVAWFVTGLTTATVPSWWFD